MSLFSNIGNSIKNVASKVGSAVKNYASNVVGGAKIVGSAISSATSKVANSNLATNAAQLLRSSTPPIQSLLASTTKAQASPALQIQAKPGAFSSTYVAPQVTGERNGVTYYGTAGAEELARVTALSSPNVPSSYSATDLTGGTSSDLGTLGSDVTAFETPMTLGAQSDVSSYLTASSLSAGGGQAGGGVNSGSTVGANTSDSTAQGFQTEEERRVKKNQEDLINMMNELAGIPKEKANLEAQAGLPQQNSELSDLQAKQQLQTAQYLQNIQDVQNKPIANEFIAGQQGEINRRYGIDAMITSALVQQKSGQIQTAQNTIDQAMNLKYDTITKRIDTQKAILEMNYDNLSRSDQKLADERNSVLDAQKDDLTQFRGIQTEAAKQAMSSGDSTAFQGIMNATSYEELSKAGGQYAPVGTFADFSTFTSTLTPTQQTNFANIPDDLKTSVQELVNGDILLSDLVKSRGIQGTQQIQKLLNYAQSVDPGYSVNTEKQRFAFKQKWVNDTVSGSVGSRTAINTALGHLADLSEASKALPGGILKKMNSVKNVLSKEFGDPAVTNFRIVLDALGSELARIYKGGVPDASEITGWQESLAGSFSKSQLSGAFNTASLLLSSKLTALRYTYKSNMGKEYDQTLVDPDKRQALISAGINPNAIISENLPKAVAGTIPAGGFAEAW